MATYQSNPARTRWWDIPAALLLFAGIATATIRLAATNWTDELAIVQFIAGFGLLAGLALGQSKFNRGFVFIFGLLYGVFVVGWQLGSTLYENIMWSERVISLGGRLGVTLTQLIQRKPVNDNIMFLFIMALLFWSLTIEISLMLLQTAPWKSPIARYMTCLFHIQSLLNKGKSRGSNFKMLMITSKGKLHRPNVLLKGSAIKIRLLQGSNQR